jgi:hypothetical protein
MHLRPHRRRLYRVISAAAGGAEEYRQSQTVPGKKSNKQEQEIFFRDLVRRGYVVAIEVCTGEGAVPRTSTVPEHE